MSLNISRQLSKFNINELLFNTTIKNKIIKGDNSLFTSVSLAVDGYNLNNLCLLFSIKDPIYNSYSNKYKCFFEERNNRVMISYLESIENTILTKYCSIYKNRELEKIITLTNKENKLGYIKFYINDKYSYKNNIIDRYAINNHNTSSNKKLFVMKISGVWENDGKVGVSYKICSI